MKSSEHDLIYKIILIGDSGVGKSCLVSRLIDTELVNSHPSINAPSIGVDYYVLTRQIGQKSAKIGIWDTAGQERYHCMISTHFRGAHGALIVYDVTNHFTFQNSLKWLEFLRKHAPDCVAMLVGNKIDLLHDNQPEVSTSEAEDFAKEHGLLFIETSAKEASNVEGVLMNLLNRIYKRPAEHRSRFVTPGDEPIRLQDRQINRKHKKCCSIM